MNFMKIIPFSVHTRKNIFLETYFRDRCVMIIIPYENQDADLPCGVNRKPI